QYSIKTMIAKNFPRFFKFIYLKLFRIHDTPPRIALGLGLGVFSGIVPGIGPLTAIFLALIFHANRAAALLGSLLTNTWLSFLTFFLSLRIGSGIMKVDCQASEQIWIQFLKNFRVRDLWQPSILTIIFPVIIGYLVVAFSVAVLVYLVALIIVTLKKHEDKSRTDLSR
ncbi:MAG: DUF2062 domain-containing protein, partial [bacterium]